MNAVTAQEALPIETLEQVLATGDISKLTPSQKVAYYVRTCESLGLNPLTRPFRFLKLNNQEQLYATRDCTDQLRQVRGINLQIVDKKIEAGVLIVTARAQTKDGRHDEDIGAVMLPQSGESRANAVMKAITKAKRRVTLSICGLGLTDESELDTMPGAYTYDPSDPAPTIDADTPPDERDALNDAIPMTKQVPLNKAAAAATPRAPRVAEKVPQPERKSWAQWAETLEIADRDTQDTAAIGRLIARAEVAEIVRLAQQGEPTPAKSRIMAAHRNLEERYLADPPQPPDEPEAEEPTDDLVIHGEEKLAAG